VAIKRARNAKSKINEVLGVWAIRRRKNLRESVAFVLIEGGKKENKGRPATRLSREQTLGIGDSGLRVESESAERA